jgi:hypothetical protein
MSEINEALACRVLETVDAGLSSGLGIQKPGEMCVEAAVCYAMGLPHSDQPTCVSRAVRQLKITLNDQDWSSKQSRALGLRRLAIAQLGSNNVVNDIEFAKRVSELAIRKSVPIALRAAAAIHPEEKHKLALEAAAKICEDQGTEAAANAAANAADAAAANAADAAYAAAYAAYAAARAAYAAAYAAAGAAYAAADAAADAADAAAYAARAAGSADDNTLAAFAEEVVRILIDMKSPGCAYLYLTESHSK